ncbi:MAG: nucleotidyltransferase family protein [Lamprocystis purpurea]|jgi:hypothetical protein|uniref:nucleotidyltransferase family protein n=1 Tax=Lamprocystis purpurea TaxID=61598 RepID=UPI000369CFD2|nr:nucleotidyltransferase family protein [Lamprocystis purpurea]MBV5274925.1 nucleotidyltransferase family protein [Lamprocystis purpurea]
MKSATPLAHLRACLAVGDTASPTLVAAITGRQIDWRQVCWQAGTHLVTPSLAGALRRKALIHLLPCEARSYLDEMQALNQNRSRMLCTALGQIADRLNRIDIAPLLLKGANALLPDQYDGAEDRVIGDLDLLVPENRIEPATQAIRDLGYRQVEQDNLLPGEGKDKHHSSPLLHRSLPIKVELHRRIQSDQRDDAHLMRGLESKRITLPDGPMIQTPDTETRLLHNFLHAQISDRQRRRRLLNLRQLLEFAALAQWQAETLDWSAMRQRLRPSRRQAFAEYLAQAECWLGLAYPAIVDPENRTVI